MNKAWISQSLRTIWDGDPWHGPSMRVVLEDLTAVQARLRPLPQAHTIWELVQHMETWVNVVAERVRGRVCSPVSPERDWPKPEGDGEQAWQRSVTSLRKSLLDLQQAVDEGRWELEHEVPGCGCTFETMLNGVIQHNLYHTGQIALLKRAATGGGDQL